MFRMLRIATDLDRVGVGLGVWYIKSKGLVKPHYYHAGVKPMTSFWDPLLGPDFTITFFEPVTL